jgi:hypothetical protein
MNKKIYIFGTPPFSPWAALATWLHLGAPKNLHEKSIQYKKNEIIHNFCIQTQNCARLRLLDL